MTPHGLGRAVRDRRRELGWSQQDLARRLGPDVRVADIARLETLGTTDDIATLMTQARQKLREAISTMWVLEILLDERDNLTGTERGA